MGLHVAGLFVVIDGIGAKQHGGVFHLGRSPQMADFALGGLLGRARHPFAGGRRVGAGLIDVFIGLRNWRCIRRRNQHRRRGHLSKHIAGVKTNATNTLRIELYVILEESS